MRTLRHRHSFSVHFLRAFISPVRERCRAAHPGGLSCKIVGFEPFAPPIEGSGAPKFAGAERRTHWPALRHGLSRQRTGLPAHNADRRASRRSTAAFSLDLGTAFWKRTGAPIRTPLIPRGFPRFHPLHQPVTGRTRVVGPGDVSRGPRRRACEAHPQAPHPFHHLNASRWRLTLERTVNRMPQGASSVNRAPANICESTVALACEQPVSPRPDLEPI